MFEIVLKIIKGSSPKSGSTERFASYVLFSSVTWVYELNIEVHGFKKLTFVLQAETKFIVL
jgi:hypothetical protein